MTINIVCLISGNGTNLQCIIDNIKNKNIDYQISAVYSNRKSAYGLIRAQENNIPTHYFPYIKKTNSREKYDLNLAEHIKTNYNPQMIVCVGWMHILSHNFIDMFPKIINLHPALPNTFPGKNSIEDAYTSFLEGKTEYTGVMMHHVIPEIDSGSVICQQKIPIYKSDLLNDLKKRVYNLKNYDQRRDKHPEGNVLKHTIAVTNRALRTGDIDFALAALFHDIGKDETAGIHPKHGYITHWGHEKVSAKI